MTRMLVAAVVALAAIAAADTIRGKPDHRPVKERPTRAEAIAPAVRPVTSDYLAVGERTRTRVLFEGREYLSAAAVDAAFPAPLAGVPFDIAHVAGAPDGTVALAVYKFPAIGPARAAIELWRGEKLIGAFTVPAGSFGGGLGFAHEGRLVAMLSADGLGVRLFERDGRSAGTMKATSW